ncbi:fluoride efflux transporter CrcB [bacterium]|nr:fluoride efflux transporter CrcB [bacterium]
MKELLDIKQLLWVGGGGFLGAILRFLSSKLLFHFTSQSTFPWGTFMVNITGCLLIGLLGGSFERSLTGVGPEARLFLITGVLGGFTTFSAFGLETCLLLQRGEYGAALLYSFGSVLLGTGAVALGFAAVR